MGKIELTCQFTTPAFVYGAEKELELRASSIKGLMRFWWRATYFEYSDDKEMRNKEAEIFGGRVIDNNNEEYFLKSKVDVIVKSKKGKFCVSEVGKLNYFLWFLKDNEAIEAKQIFQVIFEAKKENDKYIIEFLKAFNALQLLGGIGTRSKRGFGNFVVNEINSYESLNGKEINDYISHKMNSKSISEFYNEIFKKSRSVECTHTNIISKDCKYNIYALNNRCNVTKKDFKSSCECNILKIIESNYRDARSKSGIEDKKIIRGASPLIIKVFEDGENTKVILIKMDKKEKGKEKYLKQENDIYDQLIENCNKDNKINKIKIEMEN